MSQCEVTLSRHSHFTDGTRTKCFSCGNTACRECSRIAAIYYNHRRVRICLDCIEDRREDIADGSIVLDKTRRRSEH